ncbi:energy transducer TonB [Flavobacterium flavigenum]|uniref:energy transducer TonB n=1 Tax=Flavobacterium flavigenum TaxID=3003258 RepID=UPI002482205B|nr:energy transducer TonB [Flavobacterium flavigenum]
MKKFLILILICCVQNVFSQSKKTEKTIPEDENTIYNTAGLDEQPQFPGGIEEFYKFLNTNFVIPQDKPKLKGKIYTTFIVEKDGSLSDIKVLRDLGFGTKEEAIRVLNSSPKWTPGKQNGKLVRVLFSAPILVNNPIK